MPSDSTSQGGPSTNTQPGQSIELAARFENLDTIREFAGRWASDCGLGPKRVYQVQLAVDEAFTNIVEHAYGGECDEFIECKCQIIDAGLEVTLRDCGKIFNPQDIPKPDLAARLEERGVGGLGLYFIRKLMDEVKFSFMKVKGEEHECNVLRMVKYREQAL